MSKAALGAAMYQEHERCEVCGRLVRVCVLDGYADGAPVLRRLCLACAEQSTFQAEPAGIRTARGPLDSGTLLAAAGVFLGVIVACVDYVGAGGNPGMGWYQLGGLAAGATLALFGALLRVELIAILGALVFGLAACADLLGIAGSQGIGWKQRTGFLVAVGLVAVGAVRRWKRA